MRQRGSTSVKNGQFAAADPLIALVRLLARQAAAEFAARASACRDQQSQSGGGE
jgi:hypothetical protein